MKERTFGRATATIPLGAAVSNAIALGTETIVAMSGPSGWDAAVLEFEISIDNGTTWLPVIDDAGAAVSIASATITAAAGKAIVNAGILAKIASQVYLRFASGPAGARVNQTAARPFVLVLKTV